MRHVKFLRGLETLVKGITLNSNLYTNKETYEEEKSDSSELLPRKRSLSESEDAAMKSDSDYSVQATGRHDRRTVVNRNKPMKTTK